MRSSAAEKLEYQELAEEYSPKSKILINCIKAFVTGGAICAVGQLIMNALVLLGLSQDERSLYTSIILIAAAALLTGLGLYGRLGKFGGAGSAVPITGFSNSVTSPAIEFKKEGFIFGMGAKMFILAGPVIVYGTLASMAVGIVYYLLK